MGLILVMVIWPLHLGLALLGGVQGVRILCREKLLQAKQFQFFVIITIVVAIIVRIALSFSPYLTAGKAPVWSVHANQLCGWAMAVSIVPAFFSTLYARKKNSTTARCLTAGVLLSIGIQFPVTVFMLDWQYGLLGIVKAY